MMCIEHYKFLYSKTTNKCLLIFFIYISNRYPFSIIFSKLIYRFLKKIWWKGLFRLEFSCIKTAFSFSFQPERYFFNSFICWFEDKHHLMTKGNQNPSSILLSCSYGSVYLCSLAHLLQVFLMFLIFTETEKLISQLLITLNHLHYLLI